MARKFAIRNPKGDFRHFSKSLEESKKLFLNSKP